LSEQSEIVPSLTGQSQDDAQSNILQSLTAKSPIRLSWTHYSIVLQEISALSTETNCRDSGATITRRIRPERI